jgi:hypothetical protein
LVEALYLDPPGLRFIGALPGTRGKLASGDGYREENEQWNPVLWISNSKR